MCLEFARDSGAREIDLACFFATPIMLAHVKGVEKMVIYTLYCDQSLDTYQRELLNDWSELPSPTVADYEAHVIDASSCYSS